LKFDSLHLSLWSVHNLILNNSKPKHILFLWFITARTLENHFLAEVISINIVCIISACRVSKTDWDSKHVLGHHFVLGRLLGPSDLYADSLLHEGANLYVLLGNFRETLRGQMSSDAPIDQFDVIPFTHTLTPSDVLDVGLHLCPNQMPCLVPGSWLYSKSVLRAALSSSLYAYSKL
jgi:hypothetical protein